MAEKPELAYQTFQKPHDSEWRKTNFPLAENEYGLQGLSCLHPQTASPRSRPKPEDKSANMFLIKSQTKSGAKMFGKRVNRLNRILTLDPFSTERDREERFMTARGENRTKTETELPCESHWVFSPRSLRTVPKAEIQLKLTNGTLRNMTDKPQGQVAELGCSRTERVLSGVSKQKDIRKCPQIPKRVKIEIKHPSKPQSEDYNSSLRFLKPKAHKIALPLIPDGYSNTQSSHLMQTENFGSQPITSRRMTPKTILHRFGSFFGSTSNKRHNLPHLSDDSQTSSQTELGKAFSMKVVPQSCKSLRNSSKPILFHNHSPSVNSINDTMSTANASKLSGERSSAGSFKGTLSGSLNENTVNSTRARDRQKSGSMSRGQVKMLDKLFNFGL